MERACAVSKFHDFLLYLRNVNTTYFNSIEIAYPSRHFFVNKRRLSPDLSVCGGCVNVDYLLWATLCVRTVQSPWALINCISFNNDWPKVAGTSCSCLTSVLLSVSKDGKCDHLAAMNGLQRSPFITNKL